MKLTSKSKYNKSKTFLLPLISEMVNIDNEFFNELENTYLIDDSSEDDVSSILLEFESDFKDEKFLKYEYELTNNPYFKKHIDVGNRVIYVFRFPEEYLPEYNHFLRGEYSRFGEDAKVLILHFWTQMYGKTASGINVILKIKQILYKDKKLKQQLEERLSSDQCRIVLADDAELGDLVLLEDETFKLSNDDEE